MLRILLTAAMIAFTETLCVRGEILPNCIDRLSKPVMTVLTTDGKFQIQTFAVLFALCSQTRGSTAVVALLLQSFYCIMITLSRIVF